MELLKIEFSVIVRKPLKSENDTDLAEVRVTTSPRFQISIGPIYTDTISTCLTKH